MASALNPLAGDLDHVLAHTERVWDELRGCRIFLSGGTGFFGCWLLESLLWANDHLGLGASAVVLTRRERAFITKVPHIAGHPAVTLWHGDVRTFEFPNGTFSHVIHAATASSTPAVQENPRLMFETIVAGTGRVLEFARRSGASRFLFTSSGAVYGRQPAEVTHVPETYGGGPDPADARMAYGEGKRAAEMLCAVHADGRLRPVIARCFAFVGPYLPLDAHFAVGNFMRDALAGRPIRITGDGTAYRSYLYASDLAVWLWTILVRGAALRPYNVGSAEALTIRELAGAVGAAVRPGLEVEVTHQPSAGPAERYVPDVTRAGLELGLRCLVPLTEALRRTAAWHAVTPEASRSPVSHSSTRVG